MAATSFETDARVANPVDLAERIIAGNDWPFERHDEEDVSAEVAGRWCVYQLWFCWRPEINVLHFSCAFDMRIPANKRGLIYRLMGLANERLWFGHFELWSEEGLPVFRHATLLRGTSGLCRSQVEDMIDVALSEAERYYPAFQHVVWGGKSPEEALELALVETLGEA
ncbi:MAG: YbjN domain-containing protein [Alphaproteobacteria bacterium]